MNPQPFGPYKLIKKLATGGMAEVYLAKKEGIEGFSQLLVVKRILPHLADDPEFVQMFLNEARVSARFNHPNIAHINDLGEVNGSYFIAMEYIHGEDLGRVMRKAWSSGQWIAQPLAIRMVAAACEGLFYAHAKTDDRGQPLKVVHRDISPQNILVSFDGTVKLVDFGIAKAADQASLTKSGAIKGKFAYMPPEQAAGKHLDHRADIFAIGLVLYEMLTGLRPLKRESELATLQAALECAIEPPSAVADKIPPELDAVVMRALTKNADDRYRDARQFQLALEEFLVGQRWVATSVQVAEMMATLFADRLAEEAKLGHPDPEEQNGQPSSSLPPAHQEKSGSGTENWEAPPGEIESKPSRSGMTGRLERRAMQADPGTVKSQRAQAPNNPPPPDVEPWDAPPSQVVPGARRGTDEAPRRLTNPGTGTHNPNATAIARTPSRADLPRARTNTGDVPRKTGSRAALAEEPPMETRAAPPTGMRRRVSGANLARAPDPVEQDSRDDLSYPDEPEADPEPAPEPAPRRKTGAQRSNSGVAQRRASQAAMPEAPVAPRRGTQERERRDPLADIRPKEEPAPKAPRSPGAAGKMLKLVFGVALLVVVGLGGVMFRDRLAKLIPSGGGGASHKAIFLKVETNLSRSKVWVQHSENEPGKENVIEPLGETPLKKEPGAHIGDTIIIVNDIYGARYEETITYGQPEEIIAIRHEFKKVDVKLKVTPKAAGALSVWVGGQERGKYPGARIELVEGKQTLEFRGDMLSAPTQCEIEVRAEAPEASCDLTAALQ